MNQSCFPIQWQQCFVAENVGDAGVYTSLHLVGQTSSDQLLAEGDELLAIDSGFFVGKDEEADVMVFD